MRLKDCHNVHDFRRLAKRRLPSPIFHYIDGAADDETTAARNVSAFETCDLVPNVLAGVSDIDLSTTVMGQKLDLPLFCSPTALQRLFHYEGERAVARAAEEFGTMFGVSSVTTVSVEDIGKQIKTPKLFQLYYIKDRGATYAIVDRAKASGFDVLALTVDTIAGGNRERDLRTGFKSPIQLTPASMVSFATHPAWAYHYLTKEKFSLPMLDPYMDLGTNVATSVSGFFSTMADQSITWKDAEDLCTHWDGAFCLKGIMSVADAKRAVDIGASGIMISNHGGRQLDGSRAPFDQLAEIVDAVGDKIDVICDGGIRRGSHVLKALSLGAKACSGGRWYLFALAAAGHAGVHKALTMMRAEIERDMKMMGKTNIEQLTRANLRNR